jgi:hypothetical protein
MWPAILNLIAMIVPSIPSLVTDAENIFRTKPKSGTQKAAAVINFFAPLVAETAQAVEKLAPPDTNAAKIATAVEKYTRAVNDAVVVLANELGAFPHATATPAK